MAESEILARVWEGLDPTQVWDCHAHLVGVGDSGGGAWFTPKMNSMLHLMLWLHKKFYMNAGGVRDTHSNIDQQSHAGGHTFPTSVFETRRFFVDDQRSSAVSSVMA